MCNLTYKNENKDLWIALLSYSYGLFTTISCNHLWLLGRIISVRFITIHLIPQVMKVKRQFMMLLNEKRNLKYHMGKLENGFKIKMHTV